MNNNQSEDQTQGDTQETIIDATAEESTLEKTPIESEATPTSKTEETDISSEEREALDNAKNPERTKAYIEKLKKDLEDARRGINRPEEESVFDSFRSGRSQTQSPDLTHLDQAQVESITDQFIDDQGNVDIAGLNKDLLTRFEETRQVQEANIAHPELDPKSDSFDPRFYELVKDRLLRNLYDNKQVALIDVANEIKSLYGGYREQVKKEVAEEVKQSQEARNQGPLEFGKGESRSSEGDIAELSRKTRAGDARALDERLRRIGIL